MDVNDENSIIREINPTKYQDLIAKGIIADGMLPKLHNAFEAINKGVKEVFIGKADDLNELESSGLLGTRLIK
jgi:acetylglutamate kinase